MDDPYRVQRGTPVFYRLPIAYGVNVQATVSSNIRAGDLPFPFGEESPPPFFRKSDPTVPTQTQLK